jgi:hypothetical protein
VYGCGGFSAGVRAGRFAGSFVVGYPVFAVPIVVPYYYYEMTNRSPMAQLGWWRASH